MSDIIFPMATDLLVEVASITDAADGAAITTPTGSMQVKLDSDLTNVGSSIPLVWDSGTSKLSGLVPATTPYVVGTKYQLHVTLNSTSPLATKLVVKKGVANYLLDDD